MSEATVPCGNCGAANEAGSDFCASCGAFLAAYASPTGSGAAVDASRTAAATSDGSAAEPPLAPEAVAPPTVPPPPPLPPPPTVGRVNWETIFTLPPPAQPHAAPMPPIDDEWGVAEVNDPVPAAPVMPDPVAAEPVAEVAKPPAENEWFLSDPDRDPDLDVDRYPELDRDQDLVQDSQSFDVADDPAPEDWVPPSPAVVAPEEPIVVAAPPEPPLPPAPPPPASPGSSGEAWTPPPRRYPVDPVNWGEPPRAPRAAMPARPGDLLASTPPQTLLLIGVGAMMASCLLFTISAAADLPGSVDFVFCCPGPVGLLLVIIALIRFAVRQPNRRL